MNRDEAKMYLVQFLMDLRPVAKTDVRAEFVVDQLKLDPFKVRSFPEARYSGDYTFTKHRMAVWLDNCYEFCINHEGFAADLIYDIICSFRTWSQFVPSNIDVTRDDLVLAVKMAFVSEAIPVFYNINFSSRSDWVSTVEPVRNLVRCLAMVIALVRYLASGVKIVGNGNNAKMVIEVPESGNIGISDDEQVLSSTIKELRLSADKSDRENAVVREERDTLAVELSASKEKIYSLQNRIAELEAELRRKDSELLSCKKATENGYKDLLLENSRLKRQLDAILDISDNPKDQPFVCDNVDIEGVEYNKISADTAESIEELINRLPSNNVLLVGCHENLYPRVAETFPGWNIVKYGDEGYNMPSNPYFVVIHSGYLTHGQYYRLAKHYNGVIIYISGTNMDIIVRQIYSEAKRLGKLV